MSVRRQRSLGLCESRIWHGPRQGLMCRFRARWRRVSATLTDPGIRVCGTHARAYLPESLVEIGSEGWETA